MSTNRICSWPRSNIRRCHQAGHTVGQGMQIQSPKLLANGFLNTAITSMLLKKAHIQLNLPISTGFLSLNHSTFMYGSLIGTIWVSNRQNSPSATPMFCSGILNSGALQLRTLPRLNNREQINLLPLLCLVVHVLNGHLQRKGGVLAEVWLNAVQVAAVSLWGVVELRSR